MDQLCGEPNKRDEINEVRKNILTLQVAVRADLQSEIDRLIRFNVHDNQWKRENMHYERCLLEEDMHYYRRYDDTA